MAHLTGQKFNMLKVLEYSHTRDRNKYWKCLCDCGNATIVPTSSLKRKTRPTKSCGCLQRHMARINKGRIKYSKGEACCWSLYLVYKRNSKKRKKEFDITYDLFRVITKKNCYYCNIEPKQRHFLEETNGPYIYNGIDRVDNKKGYIKDNVRPCCKACNYAKRSMSEKEFAKWIEKVYFNLKNKCSI